MRNEADTAIGALGIIDAALEKLATGRDTYTTVTNAMVKRRPNATDQEAVASHIGLERLDELLVRRLRAIGVRARPSEPLEATLHDTLADKIASLA